MKTKDEVFEEKSNNQTETSIIAKGTYKNLLVLIVTTMLSTKLSGELSN